MKKNIVKQVLLFGSVFLSFLTNMSVSAQVKKDFKQRTSSQAPKPFKNEKVYSLQGDFTMIGNTNLTLVEFNGGSNAGTMKYVDIDNDPSTINSSSSTLVLENPECSEIVYAGLYWTGRAHDIDKKSIRESPDVFSVDSFSDSRWFTFSNSDFFNNYRLYISTQHPLFGSNFPQYDFDINGKKLSIRFDSNGRVSYQENGSGTFISAEGQMFNGGGNTLIFTFDKPLVVSGVEIHQITRDSRSLSSYTNKNNNVRLKINQGKSSVKTLDKRRVKFKKDGNKYIDIVADPNDIYYPKTTEGAMYAAYADVTDYVREKGVGEYFVADMALNEGNGGGTGYYGGWGMVVIYKNQSMNWRNITVFDGYGYMSQAVSSATLRVEGFRAVQKGDVKIKMGMMAGEGDEDISGDYFYIWNNSQRGWNALQHEKNSQNNFFNSSIYTGGNPRNPNIDNNTGIDIAMFELENSGNQLIGNNQESTTFAFGSNQDTYIIHNIVFAVDAYVPEVIGENKATPFKEFTPKHNGELRPGQEMEFQLDMYNKGSEVVNDTRIEIPVPFNLHFAGAEIAKNLPVNGNVRWVPPIGGTSDPKETAGGMIVWEIGNLPLYMDRESLLGQLKYRFAVSDNCVLLSTNMCGLEVRINGDITGVGATSGTKVKSALVKDYGSGFCSGPVYDDFISTIQISSEFAQQCNPPVENGIMQFKAFCSLANNVFTREDIVANYPIGTKFYKQVPLGNNLESNLVKGNFPVSNISGEKTMYYAVVPGMENGCYVRFETSLDKIDSTPIVHDVSYCLGDNITLPVELSKIGKENNYSLKYFDTNGNQLKDFVLPFNIGDYQYYVAESKNGCIGKLVPFKITINPLPNVDKDVKKIIVCENFDKELIIPSSSEKGIRYIWEYSITGNNWNVLSNNSFNGVIGIDNNKLNLTHVTKEINGTYVRLKVDNEKCSDTSNDVIIEVKTCNAMTNPMLPNKSR